jgi:hypothetical protein
VNLNIVINQIDPLKMERSEFFKKFLASGIVCGCALRMQAVDTLALPLPRKVDINGNPEETPCAEKTDFTHKWIKRFMDVLDKNLDADTCKKLMQINGSLCATGALGALSELTPHSMHEIDATITNLQKKLGKENIYRKDNVVFFNYVGNSKGLKISDGYCLCPMLENGPTTLSPTYCQCSVGFVGFMFHKMITGKPVNVELLESLRGGGKACRFKVTI